MPRTLKNKPLKEAVLEARWQLPGADEDATDPHYPLFLGRLQERVAGRLPFNEKLPTAALPDGVAPYVVRYRFRPSQDAWPVIQVGPGIATLNFTESYSWESFLAQSKSFFGDVTETYKAVAGKQPTFSTMILRFINAYPFDFKENDAFEFLRRKLKIGVSFPPKFANPRRAGERPAEIQIVANFPLKGPTGSGTLHIGSGKSGGKPALIFDLRVAVEGEDAPQAETNFAEWISGAHDLIEDWFFSLIEGELEAEFLGESP
jgi:uncharacterized protein (TIGR04255 family)